MSLHWLLPIVLRTDVHYTNDVRRLGSVKLKWLTDLQFGNPSTSPTWETKTTKLDHNTHELVGKLFLQLNIMGIGRALAQ